MNWDFFDIVEIGISKGYKAKWALYQAKALGIPLDIDDIRELRQYYGHKNMWTYYMAKEFEIPIKKKV